MAVMLSAEQFEALIGRLTFAGGGGAGSRRKRLDMKHTKVGEFSGSQSDWADWSFAFKRAIRMADLECYELMEKVQKATGDFDETLLNQYVESGDVSGISSELYDLLCTVVKGDGLLILKSVEEFNGFQAWNKLHSKFNPRTTARAIRLLAEICSPGTVKHANEVEAAVQKWRAKLKILEHEFEEKIGERLKIAIVTSMMPPYIQDHIFQTVNDTTNFDTMLAKIGSWVANRVAMEGGTPMDIGEVGSYAAKCGDEWDEEWEEVAAVGAWTQCLSCHGYGHLARDCPTKGKGKGKSGGYDKGGGKGFNGKGGGKGYYKGGGGKGYDKGDGKGYGFEKGSGKGLGGKGKGYQGTCWSCGKIGHKSAECRASVHAVAEEDLTKEAAVEEVSVGGGLWLIGSVETEFVKAKKTVQGKVVKEPRGLVVKNTFEGLLDSLECDDGAYTEPDARNPKGPGGIVGDSTGLARGTCPPVCSFGGLRGKAKAKYPCEAAEGPGARPVAWRSSNGTPHSRPGSIGPQPDASWTSPMAWRPGLCGELAPRTGNPHGRPGGGFGAQVSIDEHMKDFHDKVGTAKLWSSDFDKFGEKILKESGCKDVPCCRSGCGDGGHAIDNVLDNDFEHGGDGRHAIDNVLDNHFEHGGDGGHAIDNVLDNHFEHVPIDAVATADPPGLARTAAMKFHVAPVQRPLASAVKVVQAGNRITMASEGSYIENVSTGERMPLRIERGTFVFDVTYSGGQEGTITLDSGAGVNVWPENLLKEVPMSPPDAALRMTAANGTSIPSSGTKVVKFVARSPGFTRRA
jgi:hypothetical protein